MRALLDTNAFSALMRGDERVASRVRRSRRLYMSTVVVGELLYGFRHGGRYEGNRRQLEEFLDNPYVEVVPVTLETSERFGLVAAQLRREGRPLPSNDVWIAAHALETGADLLSFDQHFNVVEGLVFVDLARAEAP